MLFFRFASVLAIGLTLVACASDEAKRTETDSTAPSSESHPAIVWDVSLWGNPRAGTEALEAMARLLADRTNGSWQLNLHYGEAVSKARENLDGIAIGAFEVALVCNIYHPQKNPALMVLTMPFLPMATHADTVAVRKAVYAHPAVIAEFARWDAMIYTSIFLPQYEFMGRGEPPRTAADWAGMTVRAGGGIGDAMIRLGATPMSSPATEVYTGVQQGTMDAASFPFTYGHVAYRIHEVADWFTNGMSPGSTDCPVVLSIPAYERLPDAYKQLLVEIRPEIEAAQLKAYDDVDAINLPMLREVLTEIVYTTEAREALRESVGKAVIEAWIAENQDDFDARNLVEVAFLAAGTSYE